MFSAIASRDKPRRVVLLFNRPWCVCVWEREREREQQKLTHSPIHSLTHSLTHSPARPSVRPSCILLKGCERSTTATSASASPSTTCLRLSAPPPTHGRIVAAAPFPSGADSRHYLCVHRLAWPAALSDGAPLCQLGAGGGGRGHDNCHIARLHRHHQSAPPPSPPSPFPNPKSLHPLTSPSSP